MAPQVLFRNRISELMDQSDESSDDSGKPRLWFVCPALGRTSEPWMLRQVQWMKRLRLRVICWEIADLMDCENVDVPIEVLPFERAPHDGPGRWIHRLRNLPSGNFFGTVGAERRTLIDLARQTRPDVILGHFGHVALRLLPLAERFRVPLVAYFHGVDISAMLRSRWYRSSLLGNLNKFAAGLAVGSHQGQWLVNNGLPRQRVHVICSGTRTDLFMPAEKRPANPVRFISASRLVEGKGVDYSIRAFGLVRRDLDNAQLHVIGDGPMRRQLEDLAVDLGLRGHVIFHGSLPSDQVCEQMQRCHVFVQHSLESSQGWVEGFGNSITEAHSCALPVVVTDCGGIRDQVIDGVSGYIVPQRDIEPMAQAMLKLARDPDLASCFGKAGRHRAVNEFDARRSLHRLETVLYDVAMRRG